MHKTTFTNAAFIRSHQKAPAGRGQWLFQQTRRETAFTADLMGDVRCFGGLNATLTEAKKAARAEVGGLWAVLP